MYKSQKTGRSSKGDVCRCSATFSSLLERRKVDWGSQGSYSCQHVSWKMMNDTKTHTEHVNKWTQPPSLSCITFNCLIRTSSQSSQTSIVIIVSFWFFCFFWEKKDLHCVQFITVIYTHLATTTDAYKSWCPSDRQCVSALGALADRS